MSKEWAVKRLSLAAQAGIAIAVVMLAASVHADIVECTKRDASGYAVLLDEPVATTAAFNDHTALLTFLTKLQFTLDQGLVGTGAQLPNADVHFVECVKRAPALDGSDFQRPSFVETLYNQSTVLEIWGSLDASGHGNTRIATAQINYMLIPIQYATMQHEAALSGMLRLEYPISGARPTGDFVELLARPQDIQALVAASLGYKALRERRFESAHQSLCQASVLLEKMAARLTAPRQIHEASELRDFVVLSAGAAITAAVAVPGYHGTLKVQNPSAPCPMA
jgi:hypothetical protein